MTPVFSFYGNYGYGPIKLNVGDIIQIGDASFTVSADKGSYYEIYLGCVQYKTIHALIGSAKHLLEQAGYRTSHESAQYEYSTGCYAAYIGIDKGNLSAPVLSAAGNKATLTSSPSKTEKSSAWPWFIGGGLLLAGALGGIIILASRKKRR